MKYLAFFPSLFLIAQPALPDSLRQLFEKDFTFDVIISRSFPFVPTLSDTYPISPFLSGHWRLGVAWHARLYKSTGLTFQVGYASYRHVLRATSASIAPYADQMPEGYRWLKYRQGNMYAQMGLHWRTLRQGEFFPRYWVELGTWGQRQIGSSIKYIAVREGRTEKVRWEGYEVFAPWQAGLYLQIGRQWLAINALYHLLPIFLRRNDGADTRTPVFSRWEVGFLVAL
ncbi:MAG: hypothetical protein NZZ60_07885 [Bacteroidia bacterium]|nr:hypothetical protein [Bacteroidia bacterium]MCX7653017.1 hypothetical protein [Bacteroidia bacterium]MDW8416155.1 hypothetical protein [Bacteroidia bacterium]